MSQHNVVVKLKISQPFIHYIQIINLDVIEYTQNNKLNFNRSDYYTKNLFLYCDLQMFMYMTYLDDPQMQ